MNSDVIDDSGGLRGARWMCDDQFVAPIFESEGTRGFSQLGRTLGSATLGISVRNSSLFCFSRAPFFQ